MASNFIDIPTIVRELTVLGKYYRPKYLKILGGEPLLHPKICDVLEAVRQTNFCDRLRVGTNGVLLHKMPPKFWDLINDVEVSVYPGHEPDLEFLKEMTPLLVERGIQVRVHRYTHFREAYSEVGTKDQALIQDIFNSCQTVHTWKSHAVVAGRFFKCPPSYFMPRYFKDDFMDPYVDGIEITDSPDFRDQLSGFLNAESCLKTCSRCLGTVGRLQPHEQIRKKELWLEQQKFPTEDMVDLDLMAKSRHAISNDLGHVNIGICDEVIIGERQLPWSNYFRDIYSEN